MTNNMYGFVDKMWNPLGGECPHMCGYCYVKEKMAYRLKCMGVPKYQDVVDENGWTGKIGVDQRLAYERIMGDLFHENVSTEIIKSVFDTIYRYRHHVYMILTKHPKRLAEMVGDLVRPVYFLANWAEGQFPDHLWIGVSAENQRLAYERIPILLKIPAKVRFVSVEPMLSRINLETPYGQGVGDLIIENLDWVLCGPETGPKKRPFDLDWARDLRDQCRAFGVPFFMKRANEMPDDLKVEETP